MHHLDSLNTSQQQPMFLKANREEYKTFTQSKRLRLRMRLTKRVSESEIRGEEGEEDVFKHPKRGSNS